MTALAGLNMELGKMSTAQELKTAHIAHHANYDVLADDLLGKRKKYVNDLDL